MAGTRRILGPDGKPFLGRLSDRRIVRSRYDSAQTTQENARHWQWADSFSARSANNSRVRWTLRNRSRYEAANNCYASGLAETLADDLVGAGPNLEMRTGDDDLDQRVEDAFWEWSQKVELADKLHTMRQARAVDGEAFLFLDSDPDLGPVQLDLQLYEADQVSTPFPYPLDPRAVDGIVFNDRMKPRSYHLLRTHPGDDLQYGYSYEFDVVPARFVIHWFLRRRPRQYRGVPEFTPALPLFAQLRRFTLAVLTGAEVAAEYSAVLQSDLPPEDDEESAAADDFVPMESFNVERGMMATLPAGWKMNQFRPEQPTSNYEMFKRELLCEIARTLKVPYNVAAGNSSGYNYASGRLDHQSYYRTIGVDQARLEREVLDRIFTAWLEEAARATDLVPGGVAGLKRPGGWYRRWLWPGLEHVDPVKEAMAQQIRLRNGMTSFSEECYRDGVDPMTRRKTMARDMEGFEEIGIPYPYLTDTSAAAMEMAMLDEEEAPGEEEPRNGDRKKATARTVKAAATATPTSLSFTATAEIDLEARSADGKPKLPTFAIRGYTGAVMGVGGFFSPVIVDLGGLKAASQTIPAFLDHDTSQIVGQTDSVAVSADGVDLTGTIMAEDGVSDRVKSLARNGFKWQASIGANIIRQEFLKAGEKTQVNSREVSGPLVIVRESKLFEISFVAIGADSGTSAAVAAKSNPSASERGEPTVFEKWLQAKGIDPAALTDVAREFLQATYDAEQEAEKEAKKARARAKDKPAASLQDIAADRKADRERVERITAMAEAAMDERPAMIDEVQAMADAAIEGKNTVAEFELEMLRLRLNSRSAPVRRGGRSDHQVGARIIEATVCLSGGIKNPEKHYDQQTLNASYDRFPHGLGLRDLLTMAARENGYTGYSSTDVRPLLEAAFPRRGDRDVRAEGFSTLSLPGTLSNIANKFLVAGFNAVENSWKTIAATRNVRDFKTVTSYALTGGFVYDKVGPGGELHHATVGELAYTNKADTYGKMFAITRTDIINDDLGALTQVPMKLGRGAALKINDVFWTTFLATVATFYTSGRGNLISGAGSALASAGLQSALLAFRKLTDVDGLPTGIIPKYLVTPPELEVTAAELMTSMVVNTGGASTSTKVPSRNVWENKYTAVSSVYLSNAAYPGSSTTAWYLIADPADLPLVEVAFLNGRETPIVESADAEFDSLGIQMRGYHDFGCALQEYRAGVRSAGT